MKTCYGNPTLCRIIKNTIFFERMNLNTDTLCGCIMLLTKRHENLSVKPEILLCVLLAREAQRLHKQHRLLSLFLVADHK